MSKLNIFANFFIDSHERFLRMQDSFASFKDINASKWVINVRGRYAEQTLLFLKNALGEKLIPFKLHSENGWFYDTRQMLPALDGDYILFWLEDHICMCGSEKLYQIVQEMSLHKVDQLIYTWWQNGSWLARYAGVIKIAGTNIEYFDHENKANESIQQNGATYLISATGIFSNKLFHKIILVDDPVPKRWPKETPFDFEKAPTDVHWLPFRAALPKEELFASIDDDHGVDGYCLQSRGLYPKREERMSYASNPKQNSGGKLKLRIKPYIPTFFLSLYYRLYHKVWRPFSQTLKFYYVQRIKGFDIPSEPHFDSESLTYFIERLKSSKQYLEYGSGGSTFCAAKLGKNFTTVDSDKFFLKDVQKKIKNHNLSGRGSQKYLYADIGLTKTWGDPVFTGKNLVNYANWARYSSIPWENEVDFLPDLILIDGRFRVACALKAIKILHGKNNWLILFDDYAERDQYKEIERFAILDKFVGRMAVFKEMPNIDFEALEIAIKKFELDFD